MADEENHPEEKSDIEPVTLPPNGFQSRIPSYLLEGKSEAEQYVLNEVSKMGHFIEWAAPILMSSNLEARRTNGKVKTLWALKNTLTGYKGLFIAIFGAIGAIAGAVQSVQYLKEILSPPAQSAPANPATQVPANRPFP